MKRQEFILGLEITSFPSKPLMVTRKVAFSPSAIFSLDKLEESVCAEKH